MVLVLLQVVIQAASASESLVAARHGAFEGFLVSVETVVVLQGIAPLVPFVASWEGASKGLGVRMGDHVLFQVGLVIVRLATTGVGAHEDDAGRGVVVVVGERC